MPQPDEAPTLLTWQQAKDSTADDESLLEITDPILQTAAQSQMALNNAQYAWVAGRAMYSYPEAPWRWLDGRLLSTGRRQYITSLSLRFIQQYISTRTIPSIPLYRVLWVRSARHHRLQSKPVRFPRARLFPPPGGSTGVG